MTHEEIARRRDDIVGRWGPWRFDNLRLSGDLFTIGEGAPGNAARLRRGMQQLRDLAGGTVSGLRVLDLGAGEGGLAIELGKHGADVVALDGRLGHVEKGEFVRDALDVRAVTFIRADVRRLSVEEHGFFDVVVALSLLDHLDAPDVFDVVRRIGAVCKRFALIEARLAARPRGTREFEGIAYRGAPRREHPPTSSRAERLAAVESSLDNDQSFHLTRSSMLRLLARTGFTSCAEMLAPDGDPEAPRLAAFKGRRVALAATPQANALAPESWDEPVPAAKRPGIARLIRPPKR
jgi:SAM-dependent methyltransferase